MMLRCECWRLGFVELRRFARRRGITSLRQLMALTGCGTRCGKCRPYIRELLQTGRIRCGDQFIDLPDFNCRDK